MVFYICTKVCQSISQGFSILDMNSRVDARVVANVDGRTDVRTYGKPDPYTVPCLRQARQKLHRTDLVICSHSREGKSLSYSSKLQLQISKTINFKNWGIKYNFCNCPKH